MTNSGCVQFLTMTNSGCVQFLTMTHSGCVQFLTMTNSGCVQFYDSVRFGCDHFLKETKYLTTINKLNIFIFLEVNYRLLQGQYSYSLKGKQRTCHVSLNLTNIVYFVKLTNNYKHRP